jgi:Ser-Thr-rich glycosyl-phosphatidyl-inositol-anchored membrane family
MRGLILYLGAFLLFFSASAQNVVIKNIELAGEKVIVFYDLDDNSATHEYLLQLYSSRDNFAAPLTKVKGDVGAEIKPGVSKKIEWNIREEFGGFKGRLSLEIRGKVFVPFVKLQNFDSKKAYKRGKAYNISWKPGNNDPIHIELFKGSERVTGELNQPNNGSYTMTFPSHASPGKDYRIKITDSKSSEYVVFTDYFKVTPKVPLLLKVLPVVAIVAVVVVVVGGKKSSGDSGGGGDTPAGDIEVPDLPK